MITKNKHIEKQIKLCSQELQWTNWIPEDGRGMAGDSDSATGTSHNL